MRIHNSSRNVLIILKLDIIKLVEWLSMELPYGFCCKLGFLNFTMNRLKIGSQSQRRLTLFFFKFQDSRRMNRICICPKARSFVPVRLFQVDSMLWWRFVLFLPFGCWMFAAQNYDDSSSKKIPMDIFYLFYFISNKNEFMNEWMNEWIKCGIDCDMSFKL